MTNTPMTGAYTNAAGTPSSDTATGATTAATTTTTTTANRAADMPAVDVIHVPLYRLAHSRSGDKGDISNLSLIAWDPDCYAVIESYVTSELVREWFSYREPQKVTRYLLPTLHAMNFVLEGVLDGGVNDALNLDAHGKSLSFWLLDLPVPVTAEMAARLPDVPDDPCPGAQRRP